MKKEIYFVDLLQDARIDAPHDNYVEIQRASINRISRTVIFHHPDSSVVFRELPIGRDAILEFETGMSETVWDRFKGKLLFEIMIRVNKGERRIFHHTMDPLIKKEDRGWNSFSIALDEFAGQEISIIFRTTVEGPGGYAWAFWANPVIQYEVPEEPPRIRKDDHLHIFMITADALSRRLLGCYGNREMQTPNIDAFARESMLFEDAWSQATTTMGSYGSIWSGLHPLRHKLFSEWGEFPAGVISLPVVLSSQGYYTYMLASEAELSRPVFGFDRLFNEVQSSVANPAQDGAITLRQFSRWLENRPDRPIFAWLQFFDTHPPSLPPEEFAKIYYGADPETTVNHPEWVAEVYGIESMSEIDRLIPLAEQGILPGQSRIRLLDTAEACIGKRRNGPDLFEHILNLSDEARNGMSLVKFGHWLENEIILFSETGKVSEDLIKWLYKIREMLRFVQESITGWLKNVKDFDYPVSMYKSSTTYFDHLMGRFLDALKEQGIYDQSIVILTSPHGEIFRYKDVMFHHHIIHPHVLSVPLIIKAVSNEFTGRLKGVASSMDLFPTLLDMLGLGNFPLHLDGKSRYENMKSGLDIPETQTLACDINSVMRGLIRPPYIFTRAEEDYQVSKSNWGRAGEDKLFRITGDEDGMEEVTDATDVKKELSEMMKGEMKRYE